MLKGTTKIELTDANTGETQVIEKHNNVTGALQELFNPVLGHLTVESALTSKLPAYTSFLGGLLLFDSRIDGDPLPLYAPEDVKLIGCARYNTANTMGSIYMGSYDVNESVLSPQTKMAKLVYNFTQSQANGTINSVCLTHHSGGLGSYRSDFQYKTNSVKLANSLYASPTTKLMRNSNDRTTGIKNFGEDEHLYAVDIDNDIAYYFRVTATNTLVLVKRKVGLKQYSIFGNADEIIGEPITITLATGIHSNYNAYNFDPDDNALYILSGTSDTVPVAGQFTVTKIILGEATATQVTLTNNHNAALAIRFGYVYRGKVYIPTSRTIVTINGKSASSYEVTSHTILGNEVATHGTVINSGTSSEPPKSMYAADGRLYWQGYFENATQGIGGLYVTDCTATPDSTNTTMCGVDTIDYSSGSTSFPVSCIPVLNHPMLKYLSCAGNTYSEGFYYLAHYLGTVNNLATPIVKAPTQTMKITYTIQEV